MAEVKYAELLKDITEVVGPPKNYGLSEEDQNELDRRKEEERRQKLAAEAAEKKRRNEATLAEMATQYTRWVSCGEEERYSEVEWALIVTLWECGGDKRSSCGITSVSFHHEISDVLGFCICLLCESLLCYSHGTQLALV